MNNMNKIISRYSALPALSMTPLKDTWVWASNTTDVPVGMRRELVDAGFDVTSTFVDSGVIAVITQRSVEDQLAEMRRKNEALSKSLDKIQEELHSQKERAEGWQRRCLTSEEARNKAWKKIDELEEVRSTQANTIREYQEENHRLDELTARQAAALRGVSGT